MDDGDELEVIQHELSRIKKQRRELRAAEYELTKRARVLAVRALIAGLPVEEIASASGYSSSVVGKWKKSLTAVQRHKALEETRFLQRVARRGQTSARQRSRMRRVRAVTQEPGWKAQVAPWVSKKRRR
ncbi:hypothetical protein ACFWBB_02885 [Streptomyces sp. NPDC060000]|uniref:hypothetical protein n=1 Tax=Streptomyces sp. NPDC060000 TaxID=3347031 RepID=UPI00367D1634